MRIGFGGRASRVVADPPIGTGLQAMEGRTIPGGPIVASLLLADGTQLRTARWERDQARGTVLICTGRGEFIEKYYEVVAELLARDFAVVVFDWRGQGLSTRALKDRRKGHIASFSQFEQDLAAVLQRIVRPFCPQPIYGLAHSMGGAIAMHYAFREPQAFRRIVLSAPMVGIHDLPLPNHLRKLVRALNRSGFNGAYLPKGQKAAVLDNGFVGNVLTSDPQRFAAMASAVQQEPSLAIGAPTIGWLHAAFEAMALFDEPGFYEKSTTPMLMVIPGADRVVSVRDMQRCAQRLRACQSITIPHARHEILMERDELRDQFWAAFDAFVPGSERAQLKRSQSWAML